MIKMLTACTAEIDDADEALDEILKQIDLNNLLKNSVGILTCYYEFIENGVVRALCDRMPFDVIGGTTAASSSCGKQDMYLLSFTVLTSDDVSFSTAFSAPLQNENCEESLTGAYRDACARLPGEASFIFSIFPFVPTLSAAAILKDFDRVCGGTPIFGGVASDVSMSLDHSQTICNGETAAYSLAMILMHGPVKPQFFMTALPERNIRNM
ncbi:MAG: hypothetical protein LBL09_02855 [Oscillospiraceae bacterium]|jgi:hypothetical protein|nr:hypothetical protein [Oscillospiraceae bacterium]